MGRRRQWPEPPSRSPRGRHGRFVNYARTASATPVRWLRPRNEEEVIRCVATARASGQKVKVVGAGHSWSPIGVPVDLALTLDGLSGIVERGDGWVRVRAGTRLRRLLADLAAEGQTLATVTSVAQQSIAGALATGSHGSSLGHGNLSTLVTGARLVRADGSVLDVKEGDGRLDALRVHLGALGVVTDLTLRTTPSFRVAETIERVPVEKVGPRVEQLGRSAEYVKIWWLPYTSDALIFRGERTDEPATRWPAPEARRLLENWVPRAVLPPLFAWQNRRPGRVPAFNRTASHWLATDRRVGVSTLMLSTPEPPRHHETEGAVALPGGGDAFERVVRMIGGLSTPVNFILELRYCRGDGIWMSPAYGADVVHLGACTALDSGRREYFEAFWREMRRFDARPHWAKEMDHAESELRPLYPMADRFVALRDDLDPDRLFANPFLDRILGP